MAATFARGLAGDPQHETDLAPASAVLAGCGNSIVDLTLLVSQPAQGQTDPPQVRWVLSGRGRGIERASQVSASAAAR